MRIADMEQIVSLIKAYEAGELTFEQVRSEIENQTGKVVAQYTLDNYWRSEDIEELAKRLAMPPIEQ